MMDEAKAKKLIERSIQIVDGEETLVIDVVEDCPFCVEEIYGKLSANKIYENYLMYPVCAVHSKKLGLEDETNVN